MNNHRHLNKTFDALLQGLGAAIIARFRGFNLARRVGVALFAMPLAIAVPASAQQWDNSNNNPYVSAGYGDQCTAFAWGRFKLLNGESLQFQNSQGKSVYPNANLMATYAVESSKVYRDSVPVRGALVSFGKSGTNGHVGIIERANTDGSADISEQNWPVGSGPNTSTLSSSKLQSRSGYNLLGYVNPNRPSAIGTLSVNNTATTVQAQFTLMDEDRRPVNLQSAIVDNGQVVPGTTLSGNVRSNVMVTATFRNTTQFRRGKSYTLYVWAADFRGLRSSKSVTFTW